MGTELLFASGIPAKYIVDNYIKKKEKKNEKLNMFQINEKK